MAPNYWNPTPNLPLLTDGLPKGACVLSVGRKVDASQTFSLGQKLAVSLEPSL